MKICFCLFKYYPFGGLERDFMHMARESLQRGHTIDVYTMDWHGDIPYGLKIHIISPRGISNHTRCRSFINQLKGKLSTQRYDLIVGFNRMPGLDIYYAADLCYQATVRLKHGAWYRALRRYRLYRSFEQAVFAPPSKTKILLLSATEQQQFMHYYKTPSDHFYVLPPGIDKERIIRFQNQNCRTTVRAELNIDINNYLILMVGSDFKRKGVDRALLSLAALPEVVRSRTTLVILGAGNHQPYQRLSAKLAIGQQVMFLGATEDIGRYMLAADLLLHPAYAETAGMVLLEALVAGLPVLVTENCGYAFHIQNAQAGVVVPTPFQQSNLNTCLQAMLNNSQLEVWRQNALAYAKNLEPNGLTRQAVDLLEQFYREKQV